MALSFPQQTHTMFTSMRKCGRRPAPHHCSVPMRLAARTRGFS